MSRSTLAWQLVGIDLGAVRNEEAGPYAAAAEAQLTGPLAVCAGSCGSGSTHLVQGLYDANRTRPATASRRRKGLVVLPDEQVRALARRLNEAGTVALFCGAGVEAAHALRGKEWIRYDNAHDVGTTPRAALPLVEQKPDRAFLDRMLHRHAKALEHVVDAYTHDIDAHLPIHPEYAARVLDEVAADDAVFAVDTGVCDVWAARYITP